MEKTRIRYLCPGRIPVSFDTLTIELTNKCSLACSCCPNGRDKRNCRKPHTLSLHDFRILAERIDVPFKKVFLHLHGEPFLNPDIPDIVSVLKEKGVEEFSVFSNGYNIDVSLLDRFLTQLEDKQINIAFSAELYDRGMYENIRCGSYDAVWNSMQRIDEVMKRHSCQYSIKAIINSGTIGSLKDSIPEMFRRLPQLKDIHLFSAFPWPHLPETGDIAGHMFGRCKICDQIWDAPVVLASGEVSMCSSDYRGECVVGSLWNDSFSSIVNNDKARRFRRNIALRHPERNSICAECLIPRVEGFSKVVRRKFVEKASPQILEKYFENYNKYFKLRGAYKRDIQE